MDLASLQIVLCRSTTNLLMNDLIYCKFVESNMDHSFIFNFGHPQNQQPIVTVHPRFATYLLCILNIYYIEAATNRSRHPSRCPP